MEKLSQNKKNNFDIISDFMGKGIFKKNDEIMIQLWSSVYNDPFIEFTIHLLSVELYIS